jgi:hypothetical protein
MLILNREQRRLFAETVRDIANVAAGAMVFGQFLSGNAFAPRVMVAGAALWIVFVSSAVLTLKGGRR